METEEWLKVLGDVTTGGTQEPPPPEPLPEPE